MHMKISAWAATDLYVNGRFISSFGSTGLGGRPYHEFSPYGHLPVEVDLRPGNEYTIALHLVDWLSPIPPRHLKSEDVDLNYQIRITGPAYTSYFLQKGIKEATVFSTIWIAVTTILCFLFWFLYFQNPLEKKPSPDCLVYYVCCYWNLLSELGTEHNWPHVQWISILQFGSRDL